VPWVVSVTNKIVAAASNRAFGSVHGTADVNVPYLHSVRLLDEVMKKGRSHLVEFMAYPGEFHYFTREHVLRDAWQRVDAFFKKHLQNADPIAGGH
jgi:fermentation-respiration switch protein FrsA (DUF1100 family)